MAAKGYRFVWNSRYKKFELPSNFTDLSDINRQRAVLEIIDRIRNESGLIQWPRCAWVLLLLLTYFILLAVSYLLISTRPYLGGVLLTAAPFVSFPFIGYLMLRKSGIYNITRYLDNNNLSLQALCSEFRLSMSHQFSKKCSLSSAVPGPSLQQPSDAPTACFSCSEDIEGFVEFDEFRPVSAGSVRSIADPSSALSKLRVKATVKKAAVKKFAQFTANRNATRDQTDQKDKLSAGANPQTPILVSPTGRGWTTLQDPELELIEYE